MKFAKLSLAAIIAMGVSAFADVENIKINGDAKFFYSTNDMGNADLFDRGEVANFGSAGQAGFDLSAEAALADGVTGKVAFTVLSTLGVENNLVSYIWEGSDTKTQWWASEAWLAKKISNTTIKVGRQTLDTPLAFTETWSIAQNTFESAVVLNQDIKDTVLVAAWVGRGNGGAGAGGLTYAGVVNNASNGTDPFTTYGSDGAYVFGAVTTAIPMTTAQAWYYDVVSTAKAYWLQADVALENDLKGLTLGAQYASTDPAAPASKTGSIWAAKVGYATDNGLSVSAAYSSTDTDNGAGANTATGTGASKVYTEAWWNYGYVTAKDVNAYSISAEYNAKDIADFAVYYTNADAGNTSTVKDMSEFTATASRAYGNLETTLAYIYTDADDQNNADAYNTVQLYLTYNF